MRGRGLKRVGGGGHNGKQEVAPRAGARIETSVYNKRRQDGLGRSPCGGVD